MGTTAKFIATCVLLAGASGAFAQVKCTMPNGKTITLQSAPRCPADATKAETLDGKPLPKPSQTPEGMQVLEQQRLGKEAIEQAKVDRESAAIDAELERWKEEGRQLKTSRQAQQKATFERDTETLRNICKAPETRNFLACEVKFNALLGNSVDITDGYLKGLNREDYCKTVASKLRKHLTPGSPVSNTWTVRIWAPMKSQVQVQCIL